MTYTIKFSDGRTYECSDYATEVTALLADRISIDYAIGDAEVLGEDEAGRQVMRRLVWSSEDEAENDDGARAVASVRWTL